MRACLFCIEMLTVNSGGTDIYLEGFLNSDRINITFDILFHKFVIGELRQSNNVYHDIDGLMITCSKFFDKMNY